MEAVIYDSYWQDIQEQDWPEPGTVYVCLDPQKRLGDRTWSVSVMGDGTAEGDTVLLGLFWQQENAAMFAELYSRFLQLRKGER
ncbi:MAG: hypothetical protein ACYCX4_08025 [Bacillota bacterium]